jgi:argininosuccinate lyase
MSPAVKKAPTTAAMARGKRFTAAAAQDVALFTESISFDSRLWREDLIGSKTHARMLRRIGILTKSEEAGILRELDQIGADIEEGRFTWNPELEDVHMNIEAELTRRVPAGAKLHTGRSRNDQVALDMRLWMRSELSQLTSEIRDLQLALVTLADRYPDVLIPGYTHLQRAQPVPLAHHLLAYVEMLDRDSSRMRDCFERVNVCPLGSGALAGSTLPLDREFVARELGFVDGKGRPRVTQNSMDAVSDRDFAVEFCAAAALVAVHLSRLSEDLILWASAEFGFIRIADAYTTGSSLMPQKRNPDIAELTRGKSARVIGNLVSLLTLLKGLPMTYNRDLQEDKERLFDTADTTRACLRLTAAMLAHIEINRDACVTAAADPQLLATDLADYLVQKGVPFREAHHAVGALVSRAEQTAKPLNQLNTQDFQSVHPLFGADTHDVFDLKRAMARRILTGGPGHREVRRQVKSWQKRLRKSASPGPFFPSNTCLSELTNS